MVEVPTKQEGLRCKHRWEIKLNWVSDTCSFEMGGSKARVEVHTNQLAC